MKRYALHLVQQGGDALVLIDRERTRRRGKQVALTYRLTGPILCHSNPSAALESMLSEQKNSQDYPLMRPGSMLIGNETPGEDALACWDENLAATHTTGNSGVKAAACPASV